MSSINKNISNRQKKKLRKANKFRDNLIIDDTIKMNSILIKTEKDIINNIKKCVQNMYDESNYNANKHLTD